ncbi:MAG TPA: FAD-dependent oxidoreductase [Acidimicrobiales bacterium]|nr:FAD-dependent oxidoreductase [Acidimicrobiales bacterium]
MRPTTSGTGPLDCGGTFIAAQHRRIRALASQLGVDLMRTRLESAPVRWRMQHLDRHGRIPPGLRTLVRVSWRLSRTARSVPGVRPWEAPLATELDASSVASFLDDNGVVEGSDAVWIRGQLEALAAVPLVRLSMLQLAWWLSRPGGLVRALRDTRAYIVSEGSYRLAERLHQELGGAVRRGCPVSAVAAYGKTEPVVVTSGGEQVEAVAAVVAVPLPAIGHIRFEAPLRPEHQRAVEQLRFGGAAKIVARALARPARWRTVFGGRHLKTAWRIGPMLAGEAPDLGDGVPSDGELSEELASAFELAPTQLGDLEVVNWTMQPHVRGTYIAYAPGQLTELGPALDHGQGPVWFAASERSSWPDSMEGAVESGEHVAQLVLDHLDH